MGRSGEGKSSGHHPTTCSLSIEMAAPSMGAILAARPPGRASRGHENVEASQRVRIVAVEAPRGHGSAIAHQRGVVGRWRPRTRRRTHSRKLHEGESPLGAGRRRAVPSLSSSQRRERERAGRGERNPRRETERRRGESLHKIGCVDGAGRGAVASQLRRSLDSSGVRV